MQAENMTRRANTWLLILECLQILCYCKFPLSHCHQYCRHRRIRPCMVKELQWMYEQFCMRKNLHVLMLVWLCLQCYTRNSVLLNIKEPWGQLQKPLCPRQVPHTQPGLQPAAEGPLTLCTALLLRPSPRHTVTSSQLKPAQSPSVQTEKCNWRVDMEDRSLRLGTGPPSQDIESCPDTEVWQTKDLGYVIMMKGHCSKLLVWWDSSRRWYKAQGSIVLPFVPFPLRKSFLPLFLTLSLLYRLAT